MNLIPEIKKIKDTTFDFLENFALFWWEQISFGFI